MDITYIILTLAIIVILSGGLYFFLRPKKVEEKYDSGEIRKIYHLNKKGKNGVEKTYYRSGKLNQEKHFKDGVAHGLAVTVYESGEKYIERKYNHGELTGDYRVFEKDGTLKEAKTY